ncbi:MAG: (d)CMP kinase [Ruminococcaceae bacterium]|jgi:cytidylate kinase|nr:(d)CMP kinase [Oscillospiraceae bacterium]
MKAIAIDGPSGAGKSTMARKLAEKLGFIYVDTGALYRAIGLFALSVGANIYEPASVSGILAGIDISLKYTDGQQQVILNGKDVSGEIRSEAVSMAASAVSAIPRVREFLLDTQRKLARENNVIMDGRDIGTVVLPDADLKIFLTASPEERANRRYNQLIKKGVSANYDAVLKDLEKRDYDDSNREICPLKPAEDSVIVDTTGNELEESVELLFNIVKENLK